MIICVQRAREMRCVRNGVGADYGGGHIYAGDAFMCPGCLWQIIKTTPSPHYDPEHKKHDAYLTMRQPTPAEVDAELADPDRDEQLRQKLKAAFEAGSQPKPPTQP